MISLDIFCLFESDRFTQALLYKQEYSYSKAITSFLFLSKMIAKLGRTQRTVNLNTRTKHKPYSGGSRGSPGGGGVSLNPLPAPPPPFLIILLKWNNLVSYLFHFHEIFKENKVKKSAKRTPIPLYIRALFPEILDPPLPYAQWENQQTANK